MVSKKLSLFFSSIVALFLLVSLLRPILHFEGFLFKLEIFGFFIVSIMILIGLSSSVEDYGRKLLYFSALISLINSLFLTWYIGGMNWAIVFYSIILLVLNLPNYEDLDNSEVNPLDETNPNPDQKVVFKTEDHGVILSQIDGKGPKTKETKTANKKVSVNSSKKYVGSKRGKFYHEVGSEWGKRIKKVNAVFFSSKKEAWGKGYKPHADVE